MKRVVLTGGTGLIGKEAIAPLIENGYEVYLLSSTEHASFNPNNKVKTIKVDIRDERRVNEIFAEIKPSHLLHFAWIASGDYLTSEVNYKLKDSSLSMLKTFKENGGKRAVFAGTCFEYEFKDELLKETDKTNPETIYAKCKQELQQKAEQYAKENQLSFGWGRIFYVYGHGENPKRLTPHVINSLRNNKKVIIKSGPLLKDYMYTKDIAGAFVSFLDTDIQGCVNICTGTPISVKDFVLTIAKALGKVDLVEFTDDCANEPKIIAGDNTRLSKEVGYNHNYSVDEAIDAILKSS